MRLQVQCALLALTLLLAGTANAQVFRVQAGTSTMLNAEGGSVEFTAPNYNGSVNVGYFEEQLRYGAENRYQLRRFTLLTGEGGGPGGRPAGGGGAGRGGAGRGGGRARK